MKPRIVFIHGNQTTHWSFAWAGWLKAELERLGYPTFFETFPDSIIARAEYWLPFLKDHIKAGGGDVLVGWSSGAVAAMRYTQAYSVLGSALISPSISDLGDEIEKQSGYFDTPWNWGSIKAHQQHIALFYGDDDPYVPQAHFEHIAKALEPVVFRVSGAGHFLDRETFSELLVYLLQTYA